MHPSTEWKVPMAPQGVFTQTPNAGLCEECSKVGLQVVFGWQAGNQDSVPSPRQPAVASASQPELHAPCRAMGELTQAVRGWRHHCTKSQQVSYTMRPWNPAKNISTFPLSLKITRESYTEVWQIVHQPILTLLSMKNLIFKNNVHIVKKKAKSLNFQKLIVRISWIGIDWLSQRKPITNITTNYIATRCRCHCQSSLEKSIAIQRRPKPKDNSLVTLSKISC